MIHLRSPLPEQELHRLEKSIRSQKAIIIDLFESSPCKLFTAEDVHAVVLKYKPGVPIHSVRPRLTELCKSGFIKMIEQDKTKGSYNISISHFVRNITPQLTMDLIN